MRQLQKHCVWCVVTALAVFLLSISISSALSRRQSAHYRMETAAMIQTYGQNIQLRLQETYNYADELEVAFTGNGLNTASFREMDEFMATRPALMYMEILQGETLTDIYPKEYQSFEGKTLPSLNYAHTLARLTRDLVVEGPALLQDGKTTGFLVIRPILADGEYWGQVAVGLDGAQIMESLNLRHLSDAGYDYELWRVHPTDGHKEVIALSSANADFSKSIDTQFTLPSVWTLSVIPKAGWYGRGGILLRYAAAVLLAVLAGLSVKLLFDKRRQAETMISDTLIDKQTGLLSRDGLLQALGAWAAPGNESFVLIYVVLEQLPRFWQLGTEEEQQSLMRHVVEKLTDFVKSEHFAARVGESSFALAIRENLTNSELINMEKGLAIELLCKMERNGETQFLAAECGAAYFTGLETPKMLLKSAAWNYYQCRLSQKPARDLTEKCNRLLAGESNVVFGEYAESEMTALSSAISRYRRKVEQIAYIDPGLKIGNRMKCLADVDMLISYDHNRPLTLCLIDICSFNKYNELFSIATGDLILEEVSARMKTFFGNYLYRIKGDSFLGVVLGDERNDELLAHAIDAVHEKISLEVAEFSLECRCGVCRYPSHGSTAAELLEKVQIALRYAKNTHTANMAIYNDELTAVIHRENYLVQLLKKGIANQTLEVWYQPIFNIKSNTFTHAEALLRPRDEDGVYLSAFETILVAEENQMMELVGDYVLACACRTMSNMSQTELVQMHVNLSVQQLMVKDYAAKLLLHINRAGIRPEQIALEMTETILMESFDRALEALTTLKNAGVHIILDDFGSGYSSLNYLSTLPINMLKIDRDLTRRLTTSTKQFEMLRSIAQMAEINGICVVAEGVETQEELDLVIRAGISSVQGYYYSKALPPDAFLAFLSKND